MVSPVLMKKQIANQFNIMKTNKMPSKSTSSKKLVKSHQSKIESIFKPFTILGIKFRNRILAPPTIDDQPDVNGKVTPAIIKHYRTLARQGAGTIILESAYVLSLIHI